MIDPPGRPDITDILAEKAEWRRKRAALMVGEKLAILDRLREEADRLREARRARAPVDPKAGG